jgi:transposase
MSIKHTEDFKLEAVRIALSSGLPRARIAGDLGVGKSTLSKWLSMYRPSDMPVAPQADLAKENERLRLEIRVLREEREILKKHVLSVTKGPRSSSRAKNHEVRVCERMAAYLAGSDDLPRHAGDGPWLSQVADTADEQSAAR